MAYNAEAVGGMRRAQEARQAQRREHDMRLRSARLDEDSVASMHKEEELAEAIARIDYRIRLSQEQLEAQALRIGVGDQVFDLTPPGSDESVSLQLLLE